MLKEITTIEDFKQSITSQTVGFFVIFIYQKEENNSEILKKNLLKIEQVNFNFF
jgi:hypothetical protein